VQITLRSPHWRMLLHKGRERALSYNSSIRRDRPGKEAAMHDGTSTQQTENPLPPPGLAGRRPSRARVVAVLSLALVAAALSVLTWWLIDINLARPHASKSVDSAPVREASPSESVTKERLAAALAEHPVVARLPLGDVIAIDRDGHSDPRLQLMLNAKVITLRVCHFPGASGPGNQVCLAEISPEGRQYSYVGESPLEVIRWDQEGFRPQNRKFADLKVAVPVLQDVSILPESRSMKRLVYSFTLQRTAIGEALGLPPPETLADRFSGSAELRQEAGAWHVHLSELPQPREDERPK
jgi:hypothetical protein